ncbi:DUF5819 family protein [Streptomyces sp. NBC_01477]|uniref:DUF5819 family protein n=1 Tax=Streptomyces sp. NBC_01477 TaxID=2976015 RepID=UPI002E360486|nr:DUF5819 family protein [Streptomyces sp. NBC_01477]
MASTGPRDVQDTGEPVDVAAAPDGVRLRKPPAARREPPEERVPFGSGDGTDRLAALPLPLRFATRTATALLAAVALLHVAFLFLHVAPANTVSHRYARQIQSWVYPFFEQNWRLFAPDPESAVPQISVRTFGPSGGGLPRTSGWFDLTAIDNAGVRHDPFPSHTNQNMLRRAWSGYLDTHAGTDVSYSERALMWQEYLRNIAAQRVSGARHGSFTALQLRVRTSPVAGYDAAGHTVRVPPSAVDTRMLPWWKVPAHGH